MLLAMGWAVLQAPRDRYPELNGDDVFAHDEEIESKERLLFKECRTWLEQNSAPWLVWQLSERLNNHSGLLQFHTSRNHRTAEVWALTEFLAAQSAGTYGVVYALDDEDHGPRTGSDFSNSFRVWRIFEGAVTEHEDTLFSPLVSKAAFGDRLPPGSGV